MSASTTDQLLEYAEEIVANMEARRSRLQTELQQIEARKSAIVADLQAAHLGRERLANFQVKIGPDYQCPSCWINHEQRSVISPIPSDTKDNLFRCDGCGEPIRIVWA